VFSFLSQIGSFIMAPLYWITSLILSGFHTFFGSVLGPGSGWAWVLSIIGLTLLIRAALIPLFVKQIKSSRNMQLLQPKVKELQKKYGHDRERLAQETMKLYKDTGTNPFASCLPILLQMPIFLSLFRLIDNASKGRVKGVLTREQVDQLENARIFGVRIADSFTKADGQVGVQILAGVLVLAMTATTFLTQRQLMSKNMPADAMTGQYAQQQKMLLYVLPVVFAVGGIAFPIGVLFYWTTSNLWTMCQQFYVIRNNPAPGTPAEKAKRDRDAARRRRKGLPEPGEDAAPEAVETAPEAPRRQQPKKQTRSQRKRPAPQPGRNPSPAVAGESDASEGADTTAGTDATGAVDANGDTAATGGGTSSGAGSTTVTPETPASSATTSPRAKGSGPTSPAAPTSSKSPKSPSAKASGATSSNGKSARSKSTKGSTASTSGKPGKSGGSGAAGGRQRRGGTPRPRA
jgi:YidC/Oxa1 family membrane protein insertase